MSIIIIIASVVVISLLIGLIIHASKNKSTNDGGGPTPPTFNGYNCILENSGNYTCEGTNKSNPDFTNLSDCNNKCKTCQPPCKPGEEKCNPENGKCVHQQGYGTCYSDPLGNVYENSCYDTYPNAKVTKDTDGNYSNCKCLNLKGKGGCDLKEDESCTIKGYNCNNGYCQVVDSNSSISPSYTDLGKCQTKCEGGCGNNKKNCPENSICNTAAPDANKTINTCVCIPDYVRIVN
jgi:hypothetical protein